MTKEQFITYLKEKRAAVIESGDKRTEKDLDKALAIMSMGGQAARRFRRDFERRRTRG